MEKDPVENHASSDAGAGDGGFTVADLQERITEEHATKAKKQRKRARDDLFADDDKGAKKKRAPAKKSGSKKPAEKEEAAEEESGVFGKISNALGFGDGDDDDEDRLRQELLVYKYQGVVGFSEAEINKMDAKQLKLRLKVASLKKYKTVSDAFTTAAITAANAGENDNVMRVASLLCYGVAFYLQMSGKAPPLPFSF